jgi:hypothetical protein
MADANEIHRLKINKRANDWGKANRDKRNEIQRKYRENPERKKADKIDVWRRLGVKTDCWDYLYQLYEETIDCDLCGVILTKSRHATKTTKCLDHDHATGEARNIVCWNCNINVIK